MSNNNYRRGHELESGLETGEESEGGNGGEIK